MANNYYLKNIFSVFFKDKISDKFDDLSKNMIKSDRNLYKLYLDNKIEIDNLLERNGNSPLFIKNIVMSLNGGYINKLIELFNDDYIQNTDKQYLSSHNISKEQIEFVLKHKYEMRNADYTILDRLVSLDEKYLDKYFNEGYYSRQYMVNFFDDKYYKVIFDNPKLYEMIKNLNLNPGDNSFIINNILKLIDDNSINNLITFINSNLISHEIDKKIDLEIFMNCYFNKISKEYLEMLDFRNTVEIKKIITMIKDGKEDIVNDYLICRKNRILVKELDINSTNIFQIISNLSSPNGENSIYKCEFLIAKLFGKLDNSPIMQQILNGYLKKEDLTEILKDKYYVILDIINLIYKCSHESEFIELYNKIKNDNLDYSNIYNEMKEELRIHTASIIANSVNKIKDFEIEKNGGHIEDGINIIDFKGEKFMMLIHSLYESDIESRFESFDGSVSTSIITDEFIQFFKYDFYLGYNEINAEQIGGSNSKDYGVDNRRQNHKAIKGIEQLLDEKDSYNEVVINTVNSQLKPNYILCFNNISETAKKVAKEKELPIYLIHTKYYSGKKINGKLRVGEIQNDQMIVENSSIKKH